MKTLPRKLIRLGLWLESRTKRAHGTPPGGMAEDEMALAFSRGREDALLRAVRQVLAEHIADNLVIIGNAHLADSHGKLSYTAGGISALQTLLDDLDARTHAQVPESE